MEQCVPGNRGRAGFQPAGSSGILPEDRREVELNNMSMCQVAVQARRRLEAAGTGRQDACPTWAHV